MFWHIADNADVRTQLANTVGAAMRNKHLIGFENNNCSIEQ